MERDRSGVPFENDFTEERQPGGAQREKDAETERLDTDVDSQEDDEDMTENLFGVNESHPDAPPA